MTAPSSLQLAGRAALITARGLEAGEDYTIRVGGIQVASGTTTGARLDRRVILPRFARDRRAAVVVTGSEPDRTGRATTRILIKKRLGSTMKKNLVFAQRQRVTVTGLVARERVSIKYRGKQVSPSNARADAKGSYRFSFRVGRERGTKTLRATRQFPARTAVTTFTVSRP